MGVVLLLLELPPDSRREDHGGISDNPGRSFALCL